MKQIRRNNCTIPITINYPNGVNNRSDVVDNNNKDDDDDISSMHNGKNTEL